MKRAERYEQVRALREDEGLKWREIAERIGIALTTVQDVYNDPTGERKNARSRAAWKRHARPCPHCGTPMGHDATACFKCHIATATREAPTGEPGQLWAWDSTKRQWAEVVVDLQDWERFKNDRWRLISKGYPARYGKRRKDRIGGPQYLHRLIFDLEPGERWPDGERIVIDHIDRNPLNNRRSNLKLCTQKENCANRGGRFEKAA